MNNLDKYIWAGGWKGGGFLARWLAQVSSPVFKESPESLEKSKEPGLLVKFCLREALELKLQEWWVWKWATSVER